ncbi:MAG: threonylcarbamoyl-AMP synthase [Muribaculaceae bacterium]|nr:threonylcarbamoyl-AMP synthase [Muribaculaceae bacterium]
MTENISEKYNEDIRAAVDVLRRGGLILYPTDTVWGIGCDATNPDAVDKVYKLKQRADSKALITLVGDETMLERTADGIPEVAWQLIEYSDTPLTIIYDRAIGVAPNLPAEDGSIAIRVTKETFSRALCRAFRRPLVSTSANISGAPAPAVFDEIDPAILEGVDYVCTSRRDEKKKLKASTIMKLSEDGTFKIIRQ